LLQQMGIFVHVVALSAPTHPGWAFYKVRAACTGRRYARMGLF